MNVVSRVLQTCFDVVVIQYIFGSVMDLVLFKGVGILVQIGNLQDECLKNFIILRIAVDEPKSICGSFHWQATCYNR